MRLRRGGSRVTDLACRHEKDEDKLLEIFLVEIMNMKTDHEALGHRASMRISDLIAHPIV